MRPIVEFGELVSELSDPSCRRPLPLDQLGRIHVLDGAERRAVWPRLQTRSDFGGLDREGHRTFDEAGYGQYRKEPARRFVQILEQIPREHFTWLSLQDIQIDSGHPRRRCEEVEQWLFSLPVAGEPEVLLAPSGLVEILSLPWSLFVGYWDTFIRPMVSYNLVAPGASWLLVLEGDELAAFCWPTQDLPAVPAPDVPWILFPPDYREVRRELRRKRRQEVHDERDL